MTRLEPAFVHHRAAVIAGVEAVLEAALADQDVPPRLALAMRHAVLGPGKRLRPLLLVEVARLAGAANDPLQAAAALECVHAYSLVHDDLPAMDDDDLRRGRPTVHRAFDEATAILAGDALLTLAFALLAAPAAHPEPAVRAQLVAMLSGAAGAAGMVGGQLRDLAAEGRFGPVPGDEGAITATQAMKTGALFRFAAEAGARIGGADAAARAVWAPFGATLGAAFQIADDLVDATEDPARAGKATGKDAAAGKATLVGELGVAGARDRLARLLAEAEAPLDAHGPAAATLRALVRSIGERAT